MWLFLASFADERVPLGLSSNDATALIKNNTDESIYLRTESDLATPSFPSFRAVEPERVTFFVDLDPRGCLVEPETPPALVRSHSGIDLTEETADDIEILYPLGWWIDRRDRRAYASTE